MATPDDAATISDASPGNDAHVSRDAGSPDAGLLWCVPGVSGDCVVQLALGWLHTCALRASGTVECWGAGFAGQLGDGLTAHSLCRTSSGDVDCSTHPVAVAGLSDAVEIRAGAYFTCARRASGSVVCWGLDDRAQLGDSASHGVCVGTVDCSPSPVTVATISDATEIALGWGHACARRATGAISCWGDGTVGQRGDGTTSPVLAPSGVTGISDASHVSAGGGDSCALTLAGAMLCWGDDGSGELGDGVATHSTCTALRGGTTDCSPTPVAVAASSAISAITSGVGHACALHTDGTISCWGSNESGQLGDGTLTHTMASTCAMGWDCSFSPVDVSGVTDAIAVAAGGDHTCALHPDGTVSCWGLDGAGQLGDGPTTHTTCSATGASLDCSPDAVNVVGVNDAVEIATGAGHACVRRASGSLACWGDNTYGQLGNETTLRSAAPVPVVLP